MSIHICAKKGDIADIVFLPGDPLRAKFVAENFLEDPKLYNSVRGMLGYTGYYNGNRVSVQGTGMGMPSCSIYANELINDFGVKKLVRIGSAGALQKNVNIRDIILALGACTDSSMNQLRFKNQDFSAIADFDLLHQAYHAAKLKNIPVKIGNIFSSDSFYNDHPGNVELFMNYGVLAIEMEASALYTLAAKFGVQALTILTISDHLLTHEATTSEEREKTFSEMVELALEIN